MNYTGTGGEILLNTYLGGDGSPSDRLIINGGTATGSTGLFIHNTTGQGAETTGNGILVVNAINGGTTIPGAFMLTGEVRGGAFDYVTGHYLSSTVVFASLVSSRPAGHGAGFG